MNVPSGLRVTEPCSGPVTRTAVISSPSGSLSLANTLEGPESNFVAAPPLSTVVLSSIASGGLFTSSAGVGTMVGVAINTGISVAAKVGLGMSVG